MPSITRGTCYSIFVYDIAFSIDLNEAERISSAKREAIKHKRRAPQYFEYRPAPLGISQAATSIRINEAFATDTQVDLVVYDFGGVTVIYRVPLSGDSSRLLALSEGLYENEQLSADSRRRSGEPVTERAEVHPGWRLRVVESVRASRPHFD